MATYKKSWWGQFWVDASVETKWLDTPTATNTEPLRTARSILRPLILLLSHFNFFILHRLLLSLPLYDFCSFVPGTFLSVLLWLGYYILPSSIFLLLPPCFSFHQTVWLALSSSPQMLSTLVHRDNIIAFVPLTTLASTCYSWHRIPLVKQNGIYEAFFID